MHHKLEQITTNMYKSMLLNKMAGESKPAKFIPSTGKQTNVAP